MRSQSKLIFDVDGLNTAAWPVLAEHFITPTDQFFTRSHAPTPQIDEGTWRLEVDGLVQRPQRFSFEELARAFPKHDVAATVVCAGLRRSEFLATGPLHGELPWGPEPVSTGRWSGMSLCDVLQAVGIAEGAQHVQFLGLDRVERRGHRFGFGGSIDLAKALSGEVLLASELNGAPLPPAHGFPLRVVVPGWIGARSVKWLGRITLAAEPSSNYFQSRAYRVQRAVNPRDPRDVSAGVAICEVPLNAVILEPQPDQIVSAGRLRVRGWAMGSGGQALSAVEVSADAGNRWTPARISVQGSRWTWSFWEAIVELPPGRHTLMVRALDQSGASQPELVESVWNVKGYNNNAWHRVAVQAR